MLGGELQWASLPSGSGVGSNTSTQCSFTSSRFNCFLETRIHLSFSGVGHIDLYLDLDVFIHVVITFLSNFFFSIFNCRGGYYTVYLSKGFRLVSLNMNYCNNLNWYVNFFLVVVVNYMINLSMKCLIISTSKYNY